MTMLSPPIEMAREFDPVAVSGVLSLEDVRVRFDTFEAVRGISLMLRPGHLLGLIGPNGAGKTTLLRSACGLQSITAGTVRILGEPLAPGRSDLLQHIGFTPDVPPVYDNLTVEQFLRFIGRGYDLPTAELDDRIAFWLEKVWLTDKARTKIKGLSRGMKQRIGLARTLLPNPTLVLLDEPAAGLDPAGRVQFRQLLCDLRDQGKALIVSSHFLSDMADYCTHIGIMSAGRLIRYGTVDEITHMHAGDRCRYTIHLARSVAGLAATLAAVKDVSEVKVDRESVTIEFHRDPVAAADLLSELVAKKLPIASFAPIAVDLEEAYLRVGIGQVD